MHARMHALAYGRARTCVACAHSEGHALVNFKRFAVEHCETMLVAAQVTYGLHIYGLYSYGPYSHGQRFAVEHCETMLVAAQVT